MVRGPLGLGSVCMSAAVTVVDIVDCVTSAALVWVPVMASFPLVALVLDPLVSFCSLDDMLTLLGSINSVVVPL